MKRILPLLLVCITLAGCGAQFSDYHGYLAKKGVGDPAPEAFSHCHAYGCQKITDISLDKKQWKAIEKAFRPKPKNAQAERKAIAKAIGTFETTVGKIAGTDTDVYGTFVQTGRDQLDCVDESTNTTVYLALLEQKKLIRFHTTQAPTARLPLIHYAGRWPHQTAVIAETATGAFFAVDSWFHNNGANAEIVPLEAWKDGWKPKERHGSFY